MKGKGTLCLDVSRSQPPVGCAPKRLIGVRLPGSGSTYPHSTMDVQLFPKEMVVGSTPTEDTRKPKGDIMQTAI